MTAPVPEEQDPRPLDATAVPPGEHDGELPDEADGSGDPEQAENAGTAQDQPSQ